MRYPRLLGLVLFILLGGSIWLSYSGTAPLEQWLAVLMVIFPLLHLADSNAPFGVTSLQVQPSRILFARRRQNIPVELTNPADLPSEVSFVRFQGQKRWTEVPPVPPRSSIRVDLILSLNGKVCSSSRGSRTK